LAAGFSPDPQGELKCSPDPLAAMRGPTSKEKGRGDRGGEGREQRGEGRESDEGKEWASTFWVKFMPLKFRVDWIT